MKPAGIFYYQIKDPMLNREDLKDEEHPEGELLKKLKMDGIAGAEPEILEKLDRNLAAGKSVESVAIPVKYTAKGTFSSNSKVAYENQFETMRNYVNYKAKEIGQKMPVPIVLMPASVVLMRRFRDILTGGFMDIHPMRYGKK